MAAKSSPDPICLACGDPLDYRTAETDQRHVEERLTLCVACYEEIVLGILRVWTWSPYPPAGAGQVARQRWGRRKTDC
ncbi:hypothetical protein [Tautonia plasticadhaerens]|uniref:Uncharacterized protein n=1 Tax=Tautonia plasticadhaerens TaxID=2527974 RepID=A0A518H9L9_9BACT|nr:hypothetical protein [Tautonia plasticadhaerens]QDV37543.1 hypothetical protein ElP_54830 [Tautonia plasticadhaerens]